MQAAPLGRGLSSDRAKSSGRTHSAGRAVPSSAIPFAAPSRGGTAPSLVSSFVGGRETPVLPQPQHSSRAANQSRAAKNPLANPFVAVASPPRSRPVVGSFLDGGAAIAARVDRVGKSDFGTFGVGLKNAGEGAGAAAGQKRRRSHSGDGASSGRRLHMQIRCDIVQEM